MRTRLIAMLLVVVGTQPLAAQLDRTRIRTNPTPPSTEVLTRLNLKQAWSLYVPLTGGNDRIMHVLHTGKTLLVQTRSGLVSQIDAETGAVQWRSRVGNLFQTLYPATYNNSSVFVINNNYLYSLDRKDGSVQFQTNLPVPTSAPPIADDDQIFIATANGSIRTFRLPNLDLEKERALEAAEKIDREKRIQEQREKSEGFKEVPQLTLPPASPLASSGPQPEEGWAEKLTYTVDYQPLLTRDLVALASSGGILTGYPKVPTPQGSVPQQFRFTGDGEFSGRPGIYGELIYVGARDANVYAVDTANGRTLWRHTAGTPLVGSPLATPDDLYVTSDKGGLSRLDRLTGAPRWRVPRGGKVLNSQPDVEQVLAVNPKFVYANDRSGRLVILDRIRGNILSTVNWRDFVLVTPNTWTDRLLLGAQNGLLICLHDREYTRPVYHQQFDDVATRRLSRPVLIRPIEGKPLKQVLQNLALEYQVKIIISQAAFKEAGRELIDDKPVTCGRIEAGSMKEALDDLVGGRNFDAMAQVLNGTVFIIPKRKDEKPPEKVNPGM